MNFDFETPDFKDKTVITKLVLGAVLVLLGVYYLLVSWLLLSAWTGWSNMMMAFPMFAILGLLVSLFHFHDLKTATWFAIAACFTLLILLPALFSANTLAFVMTAIATVYLALLTYRMLHAAA